MNAYVADPDTGSRWQEWDAEMAALAGAGADDPDVEQAAGRLYARLPDLLPLGPGTAPPGAEVDVAAAGRFGMMMLADLSPGQRRVLELLVDYGRREPEKWGR
ncbi:hypothetical protein [Sphaerisporangium rufum]|uniref:hypothetical protein n=1 Tax=Sphaerisporangium rufum TaxID=1381558 RepID=UPI001950C6B4|nr:hypothetical protein [Sphaerisporangium rufum]